MSIKMNYSSMSYKSLHWKNCRKMLVSEEHHTLHRLMLENFFKFVDLWQDRKPVVDDVSFRP